MSRDYFSERVKSNQNSNRYYSILITSIENKILVLPRKNDDEINHKISTWYMYIIGIYFESCLLFKWSNNYVSLLFPLFCSVPGLVVLVSG